MRILTRRLSLSTTTGLVTAISKSILPSVFRKLFRITEPRVLDAIGSALMSGFEVSSSFLTFCGQTPHQKATVLTPPFYRGPFLGLVFFFVLEQVVNEQLHRCIDPDGVSDHLQSCFESCCNAQKVFFWGHSINS